LGDATTGLPCSGFGWIQRMIKKYSSSLNQNGAFKKCCFPQFRRDFQEIRKACDKLLVFARKKNEKEMT